ncbi:MAG: hypothetical protein NC209_04455 [Alistipes sp.]|nr:hypothetical protein [Alistipes senegalensis]MCM1250377.1 hypothetical protein [Alistipes sp.]
MDGHSFSVSGLGREFPGDEVVPVEVLTPRTLLVPSEFLQTMTPAELLAAAGMPCTERQQAVRSLPMTIGSGMEIVAVMAVGEDALQAVREKLGYRASFTTPLLSGPTSGRPTVWLYLRTGILYIKVFDRSLRMAEAIPAATDADILYFIDRLGKVFPLGDMLLRTPGRNAKMLRKLVGNRFREVVCAS